MAALLVVGAAALAACGSGSSGGGGATSDAGTPKPGGTFAFPLPGEPLSIEPLNAQDASGLQVAHQVFQGLTKWVLNDDGVLGTEPDIAEKWESTDAQTWVFHLKPGVTFQSPVSRPVTAQDFVDSWTRVTDPAEPVLRRVHPGAHRGVRRPRLPDRSGSRPHRGPGDRRPDAAGHAPLPVRRLPGDARPSGRRGHAGRLHRPGGGEGLREEARGHRALRGRVVEAGQGDHARQEHGVLGRRASRLGRRGRPAHLRRRRDHVGRLPGGASSTARRLPRTRCRRSRTAARSRTARGRRARGRRRRSTSSA